MDILYFAGFNFIIYSFLGWVIEELYCFFVNKTFKKEGFLSGPIKPMYGIAMTTLVLLYENLKIRGIYMAVLFLIVPSIVEYISGYLLEHVFNKTYWSYSNLKFNLHGYICLKFSLYWMVLSFIGLYILQPLLNDFYVTMNGYLLKFIIVMINIIIILDFMKKVTKFHTKSLERTKQNNI